MNKKPKCKGCAHRHIETHQFENFGAPLIKSFALCIHDQSSVWNRISERYEVMTCMAMRNESSPCGPSGTLWEAKK